MSSNFLTSSIGLASGVVGGFVFGRLFWAWQQIANKDVPQLLAAHTNQAPKGEQFRETSETDTYVRIHTIEDGIERITYLPQQRRHSSPIVMQHGMWHGAWCWQPWQELLAERGWESHAHSLPGHGRSHLQRAIPTCTLDYYLGFLKAEIDRFPDPPILMGHSMGGALTQWYLKYVGELKAAVLVAPWPSHNTINFDSIIRLSKLDWFAHILPFLTARSEYCRNPRRAANLLLGPNALITPQALHAQLNEESILVLMQHNPPFWRPADRVKTPMLWLAGEADAGFSVEDERHSAHHYQAEFHVIEQAGHNLMMDYNYRQTAELIHHWLDEQGIE